MIRNKGKLALMVIWLALAVIHFLNWYFQHEGLFQLGVWIAWLLLGVAIATREPAASAKPPMRTLPQGGLYPVSMALFVAVVAALPLGRANWEPAQPVWDGFLVLILIAMVAGTFVGLRHLQSNNIEFGEARFRPGGDNNVS